MNRRGLASDNGSGVHPAVLAAIARCNVDHAPAYGEDALTAEAQRLLRAAFDADAAIALTFGGTGANVVALGALTQRHEAILCAADAHIAVSECAAVEHYCGGKLLPIATPDGKLTPALLAPWLGPTRGVHHARPAVVSISQPTEWGTLYQVEELRALADCAHAHGLKLHVDGARYANAAAALDLPLGALSAAVGVDVLCFGGTKNGLLGAEAVLAFDPALAERLAYARKQSTQLASKMRFLAAQFVAYLEDELWRRLAGQANAMAARLAAAVADLPDLEFVRPVETNQLFPRLPHAAIAPLQGHFPFYVWQAHENVARWVTSFDTTAEDIDRYAAAVRETLTED
ncbi:MAG: low specificity L-threonine aldolase [Gammaproteobacteria bacterium]